MSNAFNFSVNPERNCNKKGTMNSPEWPIVIDQPYAVPLV